MENKNFYHNVFFWLKEPNKENCLSFKIALQKFLDTSIYPKTAVITEPAHTDREVVNNSYTYGLLVSFENKEKHDLYQAEDAHALFLKEASHLWDKVQIFDSLKV